MRLKRQAVDESPVEKVTRYTSLFGKIPMMTVVQIHSTTYKTRRTHSRRPMVNKEGDDAIQRVDVGSEDFRISQETNAKIDVLSEEAGL